MSWPIKSKRYHFEVYTCTCIIIYFWRSLRSPPKWQLLTGFSGNTALNTHKSAFYNTARSEGTMSDWFKLNENVDTVVSWIWRLSVIYLILFEGKYTLCNCQMNIRDDSYSISSEPAHVDTAHCTKWTISRCEACPVKSRLHFLIPSGKYQSVLNCPKHTYTSNCDNQSMVLTQAFSCRRCAFKYSCQCMNLI